VTVVPKFPLPGVGEAKLTRFNLNVKKGGTSAQPYATTPKTCSKSKTWALSAIFEYDNTPDITVGHLTLQGLGPAGSRLVPASDLGGSASAGPPFGCRRRYKRLSRRSGDQRLPQCAFLPKLAGSALVLDLLHVHMQNFQPMSGRRHRCDALHAGSARLPVRGGFHATLIEAPS
jgi:hypothetical protein